MRISTWQWSCGSDWSNRNLRHWCTWERTVISSAWSTRTTADPACNWRCCRGYWGPLFPYIWRILPCLASRLHLEQKEHFLKPKKKKNHYPNTELIHIYKQIYIHKCIPNTIFQIRTIRLLNLSFSPLSPLLYSIAMGFNFVSTEFVERSGKQVSEV